MVVRVYDRRLYGHCAVTQSAFSETGWNESGSGTL